MNNEKALFAQRLITAMQAKGYDAKPSILEREFNLRHNGKPVTLYGVRKWLLGMSMPSSDKLLTLAKWLDVPPEELAFEKDIKKAIAQREARWQQEIGYKDKDIVDAFLALTGAAASVVPTVLIFLARADFKLAALFL